MKQAWRWAGAALLALFTSSCTVPPGGYKFAVIHYTQIGACTRTQLPDGSRIVAPPAHAIILFRVSRVDNLSIDTAWSFDPRNLGINPLAQPQSNLGGADPPLPIAPHSNVPVNRLVGIVVETTNQDGSDAAGYRYLLVYPQQPPGPGTLGVDDAPSTGNLPFRADCLSVL